MAKFRVRIETTRAGSHQVRYFNKGDVAGKDGTLVTVEKNEKATIEGKVYVGRNLANKYREIALEKAHKEKLGDFDTKEMIAPLAAQWIEERENANLSPRTIYHDKNSLRAFLAETDATVLNDLSRTLIQSWMTNMRRRGLAAWTIDGRLSDLRTFCKWLVTIKKIGTSPFGEGLMPKRKKSEPKYYMAGEYMGLSSALAQVNLLAQLACEIMHSAGCRKAELVGHAGDPFTSDRVKWEDITWHKNGEAELLIRAELTKTNTSRTLPLDPGVIKMLGSRKTGPIIPLTRYQFDHFFVRAREISKINPELDIHGLRHTFAKNYLQRGAGNLPSLKILMGHASIVSTMIYAQFEKAYFREGINMAYERRLVEEKIAGELVGTIGFAGELQGSLVKRSDISHHAVSPNVPLVSSDSRR